MAFALFWLAALAAGFLWTASAVAAVARLPRRRWVQVGLLVVAALPVLLASGAAMLLAGSFWSAGVRPSWLDYTLSWMLIWIAGSAAIMVVGFRHRGESPLAADWRWRRLLAFLGIAVAATFLVFGYLDTAARVRLVDIRLEAQRILAEASPPQVSPADDGRPLFEKALARFGDERFPSFMPKLESEGTAFDILADEPQAYLRRHAETIALLAEAARKECWSLPPARPYLMPKREREMIRKFGVEPLDYPVWDDTGTHSLVGARNNAVSLLTAYALMASATKDRETAFDAMIDAHAIGHHINASGNDLNSMIAIAVEHIVNSTWERLLFQTPVTLTDLERLSTRRRPAVIPPSVFRRGQAYGLLGLARIGYGERCWSHYPMWPAVFRVFFLEAELTGLSEWALLNALMFEVPYHEAIKRAEAEGLNWRERPRGLSGLLFSQYVVEASLHAMAETSAGQMLVDCALAASVFRTERGRYPETLEELVPDLLPQVPTDPFDGRPIRSVTEGDGMRIYSVGRNLTDNGGKTDRFSLNAPKDGDIVFCLGEAYRRYRIEWEQEAARRREERAARRRSEGVLRRAGSAD